MKVDRSLGLRKFDSILMTSTFEMAIGVLISLSDTAVTGHIIGADGLSAMNIISPITGMTIFTENLIAVGTSMLYARRKGEYDDQGAGSAYGMGLILSAGMGILTFILLLCFMPVYLRQMNVDAEVSGLATTYMKFLSFELMLSPMLSLLSQMLIVDGDEVRSTAAEVLQPLLNIPLSIWLGQRFGIAGIGMGTLISTVVASAILLSHFLSSRNSLHPRRGFTWKDLKAMTVFGSNDSAMFLLLPLLFFQITKFVIECFGEEYLPVLTVLYAVLEITCIFEATGEAMRPILPLYIGDRNRQAILRLTRHSRIVNLVMAGLIALFLLLGSDIIVMFFDLDETPWLRALCVSGLRIYALACPLASMLSLFNSYYLNAGKPNYALLEMLLMQFICPLVLVLPAVRLFGILGIFIGFTLSPFLAAPILLLIVRKRSGKKGFPYYVNEISSDSMEASFRLTPRAVTAFSVACGDCLKQRGIEPRVINRVELTAEEALMSILNRNDGKKVSAECCLRVDPDIVYLSIWDDGEVFNLTDANRQVNGIQNYVLCRVVSTIKTRKNIIAEGYNKNAFSFTLGKTHGDGSLC